MDWFSDPNAWVSLLTLTVLEVVLGIDNIIFISILSSKLSDPKDQARARRYGLMGAFVSRILLLLSIAWVMQLTQPLFTIVREFSGRDIILLLGGLFLIGKATLEIHHKVEGAEHDAASNKRVKSLWTTVAQIMVIDIVFSLDSVITAVGMAEDVSIMIIANVIALAAMLAAAEAISAFVERHPTVKMLALSFLVLIGTNLVAEGLGFHIPKGYTYVAMAFSVLVEMLNIRVRAKQNEEAVKLRGPTIMGASPE